MQIGDMVMKGADVLRIVERKSEAIAGRPSQEYWILEKAYPTGRSGFVVHVPVDQEDELLRPVPSRSEWDQIVSAVRNSEQIKWNKDRMKRIEEFRAIVNSGSLVDAMRLERTFRAHKREQAKPALSTRDKDFEARACEFVTSAAACSFDVTPDEASCMLDELIG